MINFILFIHQKSRVIYNLVTYFIKIWLEKDRKLKYPEIE